MNITIPEIHQESDYVSNVLSDDTFSERVLYVVCLACGLLHACL